MTVTRSRPHAAAIFNLLMSLLLLGYDDIHSEVDSVEHQLKLLQQNMSKQSQPQMLDVFQARIQIIASNISNFKFTDTQARI